MRRNQIETIRRAEFIELLEQSKREKDSVMIDKQLVVQGDVHINLEELGIRYLDLRGMLFNGLLTIEKMVHKEAGGGITLHSINCLSGLCVEGNNAGYLNVTDVTAQFMNFWRCQFEAAYIANLKVERSIDASGFKLKEYLRVDNVECDDFEIIHSSTSGIISVPFVKTDDPSIALQFRMAGIPVFMSSEAIRLMRSTQDGEKHADRFGVSTLDI